METEVFSHDDADHVDARSETIVLTELPRAISAPTPHESRTDRYRLIDTRAIIERLQSEGFELVTATVKMPRKRRPGYDVLAHGRHQVQMKLPGVMTVEGVEPRFLFDNSHDGTSRAVARLGAYRFICSNGLVIGNDYARADFLHAGQQAADVVKRIQQLARNTTPMFEQIERWSRHQLTEAARREYARLAAVLRWGDPHRFAPEDLLQVTRDGDDRGDLWTTFNRVQEFAVKGRSEGVQLEGVSRSGRRATARPLNEIAASTRFNADLWNLTEEFSQFA